MAATNVVPSSQKRPSRSTPSAAVWAALAAITVLAALVQIHAITVKSLWLDEGASISIARLDWYNFLRILWRREMNMVLYYLLLRGWLHLGDSVLFLRGLSVVFATAAIPVIFFLARKMYGTTVGLLSALLLSVNAFQVRYAQEVRSYSLLVMLVILSTYFLVTAKESGRRRDWNWYIAFSALAIYAHFFGVLVIVSHWVATFVLRRGVDPATEPMSRTWREFKRALRLIALWTAPIWIFIATTGAGPIAWIPRPRLTDLLRLLQILSGNANLPLLILYSICVLAGLATPIIGRRASERASTVLLAAWLFVPIVVVLLVSIARPVFAPRYLVISLPAWVLLAAVGIMRLRPRILGAVLMIPVLWFAWAGVRSYYAADFDLGRNDVRGATAYILDHAQPGDGILFYMLATRFPYDYYAAHSPAPNKPEAVWPGTSSGLGWRDFMGSPSPARVPEFSERHARLWMVSTPSSIPDARQTAFQGALEHQYRLVDTQDFPYVRVYLFER